MSAAHAAHTHPRVGALRIGPWEAERYEGAAVDGLGLVMMEGAAPAGGLLRVDARAAAQALDAVGVNADTAAWVASAAGALEALGVQALTADGKAALWARAGHGVLAYEGRAGIGGWRMVARYLDVGGWAAALGVSKPDLERLLRLSVWRLAAHEATGDVTLDVADPEATAAEVDALRPDRRALAAGVGGALRAIWRKCASLVDANTSAGAGAARLSDDAAGPLAAFCARGRALYGDDAAADAADAAHHATDLRVQAWLTALPPTAAQRGPLRDALACFEASLSAAALEALDRALTALDLSPPRALAAAAIGRVLLLDHALTHGHAAWPWLISLWQRAQCPLDGGAEALAWRSPAHLPLQALSDPQPLLRILQRACAFPPSLTAPAPDAPARAVALARHLIDAAPSVGWALLRLAADVDDPSLPLVNALRDALRSAYGAPSFLPPSPLPPFLLPAPHPADLAWQRTHLSRAFFDALLASAMENAPDPAPTLFADRVAPALAVLDRMPGEAPSGRTARPPQRALAASPSLPVAVAFLCGFALLIALAGWALLRWRP